jgi:hypothetical protein
MNDIFLGGLMQECAMYNTTDLRVDTAAKPDPKVPLGTWIGGVTARTLFLIVLTVVTARVASPQSETLRTVLETPGDLIRVVLGFAVCTWFVVNLFFLPKDPGAYRTWMYLGVTVLPLSLLCAFVIW